MSPPIYKECYTQYIEKKTDMPTHKHQDELALAAKTFSRAHVFKVHAIGEESLGTPVCSAIYIRILTVGLLLELQTICWCCWCWCCHHHLSLLVTHWGTCWENLVEDEQWGMVKPPELSSTYCWLCVLGLSSGWVLQDEVFSGTIATLGWGQRITSRMLQHGPHDMDVIVLARADIIIQLPHTLP